MLPSILFQKQKGLKQELQMNSCHRQKISAETLSTIGIIFFLWRHCTYTSFYLKNMGRRHRYLCSPLSRFHPKQKYFRMVLTKLQGDSWILYTLESEFLPFISEIEIAWWDFNSGSLWTVLSIKGPSPLDLSTNQSEKQISFFKEKSTHKKEENT